MSKIVHASQPVSYALPSWQSVQGTQKQCPDPPVCPQAHSSLDHAQIPAHQINNQQRMQQTRCNRQQSTGISRGKQRDAATRCSTTHFLFNSQRDPSFTMRSPSRARAKPLWICWGQSSLARAASSFSPCLSMPASIYQLKHSGQGGQAYNLYGSSPWV